MSVEDNVLTFNNIDNNINNTSENNIHNDNIKIENSFYSHTNSHSHAQSHSHSQHINLNQPNHSNSESILKEIDRVCNIRNNFSNDFYESIECIDNIKRKYIDQNNVNTMSAANHLFNFKTLNLINNSNKSNKSNINNETKANTIGGIGHNNGLFKNPTMFINSTVDSFLLERKFTPNTLNYKLHNVSNEYNNIREKYNDLFYHVRALKSNNHEVEKKNKEVQSEIEKLDKETQYNINYNMNYNVNDPHNRRREFNNKNFVPHKCININYNLNKIKKYDEKDIVIKREKSISIEKVDKVDKVKKGNNNNVNSINNKSNSITIYDKINNLKRTKKKLFEEVKGGNVIVDNLYQNPFLNNYIVNK